jgi:hypothetical protein
MVKCVFLINLDLCYFEYFFKNRKKLDNLLKIYQNSIMAAFAHTEIIGLLLDQPEAFIILKKA